MAKVAEKKQETVAKAGLPAGVKIVDGQEMALDAASIRQLMEGWALKRDLDAMKARLDTINTALIEAHGTGCALVVTGICRASLSEREAVRIADAQRLQAVLGDRFGDLVRTEVSYKPEPRLIEMACDGDDALAPAVQACLSVGKSHAVTWRAEK